MFTSEPFIMFTSEPFTMFTSELNIFLLFRPNSLGKSSFNFYSLFSYLIDPLHNKFLWNIQLLDVNYIFVLGISLLLYKLFG